MYMLKQFKNVSVGYVPDAEVEINNKKYLIHGVIDKEDIEVDTDGKYPSLKRVITPSPERIKNGCPFQNECGGCQFQHINYDYEIKLKNEFLNDLFKPFKLKNKIEIVPSFDNLHYRNKCQMTYKLSKTKRVVCGLYEEYSHNLVTVTDCMLQAKKANEIIKELNRVLTKHKIMPYDEKTRRGTIRHVYIRYGFNSKEAMLTIVTNGEMFPGRNNVIKDLDKEKLGIKTIVQNYNSRDTSIVMGDREKVLYGPGFIYENVGDYKFKISSKSFFQINTIGMKKLYDLALKKAEITKNDIVIDAYCGVGTISIFASKYAKKVIGVELNKQAIVDAKINAKINNINNIDFLADDATNFMTHLAKDRTHIDVVLMDPPRDGSTKQFINAIGHLKPRKVVYISCDPRTLKRDLYLFFENDYVLKSIDAVDMFPRTLHTEAIAVLELDE
ncbi:MAG: 23S rRNA (uracil(1939)-C(5))-methyltransferase RlmD [Erysipelotrichaceae bacterium]|nr:23S rRNA (uracil(1939)-C(5))-methyltransferase RlmD [Erysipelotrichaceae bacterium]